MIVYTPWSSAPAARSAVLRVADGLAGRGGRVGARRGWDAVTPGARHRRQEQLQSDLTAALSG